MYIAAVCRVPEYSTFEDDCLILKRHYTKIKSYPDDTRVRQYVSKAHHRNYSDWFHKRGRTDGYSFYRALSLFFMNFRPVYILGTQYCSEYNVEKNEMGGAFSAYGGEDRRVQSFGRET